MDIGHEENHVLLAAPHRQSHELLQVLQNRAQDVAHHGDPSPGAALDQVGGQLQVPDQRRVVVEVTRTQERRLGHLHGESFGFYQHWLYYFVPGMVVLHGSVSIKKLMF